MRATTEIDRAGRFDQERETVVLSTEEPSGRLVEAHGFFVWHSATPQTTETIDVLKPSTRSAKIE